MPHPAPVPEASFLGVYSQRGAYTDCYTTSTPGRVSLPEFVEAFYTTPLFKVERWILATLLKLPSTDLQARQVAQASSTRFAAWRVEQRSEHEILLDAGQTRMWLCVSNKHPGDTATTLFFGSAVVPMRSNGKFGLAFHALGGFHRLYSKLLLGAAARRVLAIARPQNAA